MDDSIEQGRGRNENPNGWDAWQDVVSYVLRAGDGRNRKFLGLKSPKVCRFCDRPEAETTFREEAHVIPTAFGNRSLLSYEECDQCNQRGSQLEDDLAKFLSLPRAISRLPGRKTTPKIRHPNEKAFVKGNRETNKVHVYQPTDDEGIRVSDNGKGTLRLTIDTPKHRPINVARALGRMLLFVIDTGEPGFEQVRSWVRGEVDWFPIPLVTLSIPSAGFSRVQLTVQRYTRSPDRNILCVRFLYSWFIVSMPVPMDKWSLPNDLQLVPPPPYTEAVVRNTSLQWVTNNDAESSASAEVEITYAERTRIK